MKISLINRFRLLLTASLFFPITTLAFFCPNTFNQINFGDTIEQVTQQCGKPDTKEEKASKKAVPEEWSYYVKQTVSSNTVMQTSGTLKTSFTFDAHGKMINISVNGVGVGATAICGNNVQLGDTQETVKAACGDPSFINKQGSPDHNKAETENKMIIFTYKSTPPVTLTFENGKLTSRQ